MTTRKVTVASSGGLHARTAGMFAQAAGRQPVRVMVSAGGRKPVQARSLLAVLSLGATCGTEVTLEADGDGAAESLDELAELLSRDLDAEPADG
jgi:phosphocarrier protein